MLVRTTFSERQWSRLKPVVASLTQRGPGGRDDRLFIEGVVWILRTGAPWRDVPAVFARWNTLYRRFRRWAEANRWERLRRALLADSQDQDEVQHALVLIDSTIVKAHPHAAGALRRGGDAHAEALGRSRGGFTTKLHAVVSAKGDLRRYVLTGGQVHDITQAQECWFGRLKQYRRVATRYDDAAKSPTGDKTARSYASLVATAALCVALSGWLA